MRKLLLLMLTVALLLCAASAAAQTFTLSMVGDCTIAQQWIHRGYGSTMISKIDKWGFDWPFANVTDMFAADDLTLANCEGVLTDRTPGPNAKFMCLGATTEHGEVFKLGHVDVCNVANNHAYDFGGPGRADTIATLEAHDIGVFGDAKTLEQTFSGVRIGFVGYTYPITEMKLGLYAEAIAQMRANGCDFIIASAHWGKEEAYKLNQQQRDGGHYLIDAGADLVFGHGSHTVQPMEIYKGKLIFYSLSNFAFGANATPKDKDTVVVQVVFDVAEDGTMSPLELYAYPYSQNYQKDFRPWPFTAEKDRLRVWQKLVSTEKRVKSNVPESFLTTGYIDLRSWINDGVDANADRHIIAEPVITYTPSRDTRKLENLTTAAPAAFMAGAAQVENAGNLYLAAVAGGEVLFGTASVQGAAAAAEGVAQAGAIAEGYHK